MQGLTESPVVKTTPSKVEDESLIPGQAAKSPLASQLKNQNINNGSNIVTTSMKTFRMVHNKKKSLKKRVLVEI